MRGNFYEQTDGVAVGSLLSPVIAYFYMETFEMLALQSTSHKSSFYRRCVDDIFNGKHYGKELLEFVTFLNIIHKNVQFRVEMERNGCLPHFLDIMVYRRGDGSLGRGIQEVHAY